MPNVRISNLTQVTEAVSTDVVPFVQSGTTKQIPRDVLTGSQIITTFQQGCNDYGVISAGDFTPDGDLTNHHIVTVGGDIAIFPPSHTLTAGNFCTGSIEIINGDLYNVSWGVGLGISWRWDGPAPTLSSFTVIHYLHIGASVYTKGWV